MRLDAKDIINLFGYLISLVLIALAVIGWGLNAYKIFSTVGDPVTGAFIGRVIGVFVVPLGAIFGWF